MIFEIYFIFLILVDKVCNVFVSPPVFYLETIGQFTFAINDQVFACLFTKTFYDFNLIAGVLRYA